MRHIFGENERFWYRAMRISAPFWHWMDRSTNGPDCGKTQILASFGAAGFWMSTGPTLSSTREAINSAFLGVLKST
jgi:hypothetical protein